MKGSKDCLPFQIFIRNIAFEIITKIYKKNGTVEIDTPIFKLKEYWLENMEKILSLYMT